MRRIKRLLSFAMAGALMLGATLTETFVGARPFSLGTAFAEASDDGSSGEKTSSKANQSKKKEKKATEKKAKEKKEKTAKEKAEQKEEKSAEKKAEQKEEKSAKEKKEQKEEKTAEVKKEQKEEKAAKEKKEQKEEKAAEKKKEEKSKKEEKKSDKAVRLTLSISSPGGLSVVNGAYQVDPDQVKTLKLAWSCEGTCDEFEVSVSGGVYSNTTRKTSAKISVGSLSAGKYTATVKAIRDGKTVAKQKLTFRIISSEKKADTVEAQEKTEAVTAEDASQDQQEEVEAVIAEDASQDQQEEVPSAPVEDASQDQQEETEAAQAEDASQDQQEEVEAAPVEDASQDTEQEAEAVPSEDASQDQQEEVEAVPSEDASQDQQEEAEAAPVEDASQDQQEEVPSASEEDASQDQQQEAEAVQAKDFSQDQKEETEAVLVEDASQDQQQEAEAVQAEDASQDQQEEAEAAPVEDASLEQQEEAEAVQAENIPLDTQQEEAEAVPVEDIPLDTHQEAEAAPAEDNPLDQQYADLLEVDVALDDQNDQAAVDVNASLDLQDATGEDVEVDTPDPLDNLLMSSNGDIPEAHLTLSILSMQGLSVKAGKYQIDPAQARTLTLSWDSNVSCDSYDVEVSGGVYSANTRDTRLTLSLDGLADGSYTAAVTAIKDGKKAAAASLDFDIVTPEQSQAGEVSLSLGIAAPLGLLITDGVYQIDPAKADTITLAWKCDGDCDGYEVDISGGVYSGMTRDTSMTLATGDLAPGRYTATVSALKDDAVTVTAELVFEIAQSEPSELLTLSITDPQGLTPADGVYNIDPAKVTSLTFSWQCQAECDGYHVTVSGGVYDGVVDESRLTLSLDKLAAGDYTVTVEALKAGKAVASAHLTFRIADAQQQPGDQQPKDGMPKGGMPKGGMAKGGGAQGAMSEEEQGFHITPGEALVSTHTSGSRDMSLYDTVALTLDSDAEMTELVLGGVPLGVVLDGGSVPFTGSIEGNTLTLTAALGDTWTLNGRVLKILSNSGIDRLNLQAGDAGVELFTARVLQGSVYARLCSEGFVSADYNYQISDAGILIAVAGSLYCLDGAGQLIPMEGDGYAEAMVHTAADAV